MSLPNNCHNCGVLLPSSKLVVSRGNPIARLMIVGEAPGAEEEKTGVPFVGRSGKLLDSLLLKAGINPSQDAYICNAVKCRPPKNRRPTKSELRLSLPWLLFQIDLVDPWIIILAGSTAVQSLLGISHGISNIRGVWHKWRGRLIMPLFHPAYLLRNPSMEEGKPFKLTLGDLLEVRNRLDSLRKDPSVFSSYQKGLEELR